MALRALCLCDGYGGFELGLRNAGHDISTVARVERDSYAAAILVERMEQARLDPAPIWDDLTTFDGSAWRGCVDIITAGFPCQPFSTAGQKRGVDDDRWLWPAIGRIIRDVGPRFVFLENVPQLVRLGLPHVLADLADYGFDAEWGLYAASAVGAPHRRQRIWILAVAGADCDGRETVGRLDAGAERDVDGSGSPHVGNADSPRRPEIARDLQGGEAEAEWHRNDYVAHGPGEDVADTASVGRSQRNRPGTTRSDGRRITDAHDLDVADTERSGRFERIGANGQRKPNAARGFPPAPDDRDGWQQWIDAGGPQPSVRRSTDGRPVGLADALHLGGNGLVPAAAGEAFTQLIERLART